jgi:NTE family protein
MLSSKPKPSSLVALAQQYERNSKNRHQGQKFNAGKEIEIRHGRVRRYHQPQRQSEGQNFDAGENIEIHRGDYSASHAQSQQQRDRKGEVFDHDEVIQLSQVVGEQSTSDRSVPKPTFDEAETLAWDETETPQTWGASLAQDDSYQVESFTSDEESKVKPEPYQKEESSVRLAKKPSEQNLGTKAKTSDPAKTSTADQKIEMEDQDFLADLQAILNGDKTYEAKPQPPSKVPASPPPASPTPVSSSPHAVFDKLSQSASTTEESPHAIFEQMGKNVAHAKAFDLGTVVLEQRLDKIEQQLDEKEARLASKAAAKREIPTDQVQQLSEEDLVQDLSLIQQSAKQQESSSVQDNVAQTEEISEAFAKKERRSIGEVDNIYYKKNNKSIGVVVKQPPIKNLVFEGGGPKGLVYVGAIKVLEKNGILPKIRNVGGSSAGAMTALAVGLGYSANEIEGIVNKVDLAKFLDTTEQEPKALFPLLQKTQGALRNLLFGPDTENGGRGVFLGKELQKWVQETIKERVDSSPRVPSNLKSYDGKLTFRDLENLSVQAPELGIKTICFTGTNYTKKTLEIFSCYNTPDMPIDLAVRISMSIPWFFQSVKYNNNEYIDGGCLDNFPMGIFNKPPYFKYGDKFITGKQGQNLSTLGLKVDSMEEIRRILWEGAEKDESGWWKSFKKNVKNKFMNKLVGVDNVKASSDTDKATHDKYAHRTIQIPDLEYSLLNFSLTNEDKDKLTIVGYGATCKWFYDYYNNDDGIEIEFKDKNELKEYLSHDEWSRIQPMLQEVEREAEQAMEREAEVD